MLQDAVEILSTMNVEMQKIDVIKRAFRYETCLSLVKVFEWYCYIGPATTQHLMRIHRAHGYEGLHKEAPQFAKLVDHIVQYIQALCDKKEKSYPARKKRKSKLQIAPIETPTSDLIEDVGSSSMSMNDIFFIPGDLYRLRTTTKAGSQIKLPQIKDSLLKPDADALYAASEYCLQELFSKELIIPKLRSIDCSLSGLGGKISNFTDPLVYQRCITRGAILWSIAKACGTNGIFASSEIDSFLRSPGILFAEPLHNHRKFVPEVLKKKEAILAPLIEWIKSYLNEHPEVSRVAQTLGCYADHQMSELHAGRPLPLVFSGDEDSENGSSNPDNSDFHQVENQAASNRGQKHQYQPCPTNSISLDLDSLIPQDVRKDFSLGAPAIIIREALNRHRDLPFGDEYTQRILNGLHPVTSSATKHNPDHTNPIRELMHGAILLKEHLPAFKMTTREGISNLLSWLGTGQGYVTRNFLQTLTRSHFFTSSLQEMIETFQVAINTNASLIASYIHHRGKPQEIPGFIFCDDQCIWGQPNHYLSVSPTRRKGNRDGHSEKFTLQEKFEPYWSDSVQDAWAKLLGNMLNQDPATYAGKRPKWSMASPFLEEINVLTFRSGLTRLQLANYLVTLEIMDPPEPDEVARWIFKNQSLGAFAGLGKMGFFLPRDDIDATRAAFAYVFHHLNQNLTEEDKEILCFGPIFIEHLLCKIGRWMTRFGEYPAVANKFKELISEALEENSAWVPGANLHSPKAFPFPLKPDLAWVEVVIANVKVCHISFLV